MNDSTETHETALINAIEEISTERLKVVSHKKCIDQLVKISEEAIRCDPTRLMLLLDAIKSCNEACYKRDLLLDVLDGLLSSDDTLIRCILCRPSGRDGIRESWKALANAIATIPELVANCQAQDRLPQLDRKLFHRHLLESIYHSLSELTNFRCDNDESKLLIIQILGRISLSDSESLIWDIFTSRAINDSRQEIRELAAEILRIPLLPDAKYETLELFIERLYLPIFFKHLPSRQNGERIYSILADGPTINDHFRYLICDKFILKSNHCLDRQRQSILLFNIAAYLSSIIKDDLRFDHPISDQKVERKDSLLMLTLLETIKHWTSTTKSLFRTYEQSLHITAAAVVLFRYALEFDQKSLVDHANKIQSMIASAMPMYLNRASHEHRDLAMCLGELLLPKLLELASALPDGACNEKAADLIIKSNIDYTDDLLYLQRLFKQDIEVIFQDVSNDAHACTTIRQPTRAPNIAHSNKGQSSSSSPPLSQSDSLKSTMKGKGTTRADFLVTDASSGMKPIVEVVDDKTTTNIESIEKDDLKPCAARIAADEGADDDLVYDHYDPAASPSNVPIYLCDCIDGLVDNNNYRYVRLCLIKAGELIDQLMLNDVKTRDQQMMLNSSKRLNQITGSAMRDSARTIGDTSTVGEVNATIKDLGVELARALLLLDNQFNIKGFKDYRLSALTSLCVTAPQLIGKYLIEEFNATSRSMQQQLDILQILINSAERLSTGLSLEHGKKNEKFAEVSTKSREQPRERQRINRFSAHAALYFYGIVHRLKADLIERRSLVISQPKSILSAFRELDCKSSGGEDLQSVSAPIAINPGRETTRLQELESAIISLKGDIDRDDSSDVDKFLERNSLSDDSYLLSRIILASSMIVRCVSQQPVLCKLSGDLLEILAAYRCHPDAGVQKSMIAALKAIRECTPSIYYENSLEKSMVYLFGPWLARLDQLDTRQLTQTRH